MVICFDEFCCHFLIILYFPSSEFMLRSLFCNLTFKRIIPLIIFHLSFFLSTQTFYFFAACIEFKGIFAFINFQLIFINTNFLLNKNNKKSSIAHELSPKRRKLLTTHFTLMCGNKKKSLGAREGLYGG